MARAPRPRVLLADDYPGILTSLERLLGPDCDIVGSVSNGSALLEATTRLQPDVAIVDLNLPEINGLDACRQIRRQVPGTKVILLTAADSAALAERAITLGASAMVAKHLAVSLLLTAIQRAVSSDVNG